MYFNVRRLKSPEHRSNAKRSISRPYITKRTIDGFEGVSSNQGTLVPNNENRRMKQISGLEFLLYVAYTFFATSNWNFESG